MKPQFFSVTIHIFLRWLFLVYHGSLQHKRIEATLPLIMQKFIEPTGRGKVIGHLAVLFSVVVWATTYISTKKLLFGFLPLQILMVRTFLAFIILSLMNPKKMIYKEKKDRYLIAGAGVCGLYVYFFMENTALTYSSVSNVGVIVSIAPFLTLLASRFVIKEEKLHLQYYIGFALALFGICLMSYSGKTDLKLNPFGDFLAFVAIGVWAVYSVLTRIITNKGYSTLLVTRTMFFYAFLAMVCHQILFPCAWEFERLLAKEYLFHFLFLGVVASALCFVTWNFGLKTIGTIQSSAYLYLSPVITIVFAMLFLKEQITLVSGIGAGLTFFGLLVSQRRIPNAKKIR
jgi:drug/metabolite transporter (DMT)-like permease